MEQLCYVNLLFQLYILWNLKHDFNENLELRYAVSVKYTMDFEEDSMKNRMQNASVIYLCLLHVKIIILDILDHIKYVTKNNIMFLCLLKCGY